MPRPIHPANLRPQPDGSLWVYCPLCPAQLGVILPPWTAGPRVMDLVVPADGDPRRDWLLYPPANRNVSAALGFSRTIVDGQLIYTIIRPHKPKRDRHGQIARNVRGQPLPRQGGSSPSPPELAPLIEAGTRAADDHVYGHLAGLPCVVACWRCRGWNAVPDSAAKRD